MWLNVDTQNLRYDLVPGEMQRIIRQAIVEGDENAARWLDQHPMTEGERIMALLIACDLANIMTRYEAQQAVSAAEQTLTEEYGRWLDSLPSDPVELCECGLPLDQQGYPHDDCQCCGDCGHYPCECRTRHEDDDCGCCEATEAKYDRADYRYEDR